MEWGGWATKADLLILLVWFVILGPTTSELFSSLEKLKLRGIWGFPEYRDLGDPAWCEKQAPEEMGPMRAP